MALNDLKADAAEVKVDYFIAVQTSWRCSFNRVLMKLLVVILGKQPAYYLCAEAEDWAGNWY